MSLASAAFLAWVQGAAFYQDVHAAAVDLLPRGEGKTWLDVGCGPGLVTRLASRRGYRALGVDRDAATIWAARRLARRDRCEFELADLTTFDAERSFDVVSATSLLIVVSDARSAAEQLWRHVAPRGTLLVVETTPHMTAENAAVVARSLRPGRHAVLTRWAAARRGRSFDSAVLDGLGAASRHQQSLLGGLVSAWSLTKA
jgi:2-polyprenyl-3-methyl-5-hydroxy-6-metoxy-1,4-benzoquinol methylase